MTARTVRLHFPDGRVHVELLTVTARANGLHGPHEGRRLVEEWEKAGDVRRRTDGGFDVIRKRPRPDVERARKVRG